MQLTVDFWEFLGIQAALLAFFIGALGVLAKIVFTQFTSRIDERLASADQARAGASAHIEQRFNGVERELREIHRMREEMLREYVRREDQIRDQTVTSAKLDALATKIELLSQMVARLEGTR